MEIVCDFQGFRSDNSEFIIKELSIVSLNGKIFEHFVFVPPYDFEKLSKKSKKTAIWLTNVYHGLEWDSGFIPYEKVTDICQDICHRFSLIYVKGLEKKEILSKYIRDGGEIQNIEELGCPTVDELRSRYSQVSCMSHVELSGTNHLCSQQNSKNILHWYNEQFSNTLLSPDGDTLEVSCWGSCI